MSETESKDIVKANSGLPPSDYTENLRMRMKITKGCKYKASKRLDRKHNLSNTALGFVSAYLVIVNILFAFLNTSFFSEEDIKIITISLSVIVLLYGQIVFFKDYKLKSYKCKIKAAEIDTILDKLLFETKHLSNSSVLILRMNQLSKKYTEVIKNDEIGHTQIDYIKFLMDEGLTPFKLKEYKYSIIEKLTINFRYYLSGFLHYYALIYLTPIALLSWYIWEKI